MKVISTFSSRHQASEAAALALSSAIGMQLETQATAAVVVSGGSTPLECFSLLAEQPVEWGRVEVTLSDDRCVDVQHPDSNQKMLRENLLVGPAADASYRSPDEPLTEPFAAVLVGMGSDGHFASLFPDADNLEAGLDSEQSALTITISTAASPHQRISMPMARLLRTKCLILLAFGDEKRAVIDTPGDTPVGALFNQTITPVQIFWAK